jgi:hypothetical protein
MQHGCMKRLNRKRGPEVWQLRWSITGLDGKCLYHKKIVGTVERYPDENAARRAVVGLVLEINTDARSTNSGAMTVAQLCDHFEQRELARENTWRSHATKIVSDCNRTLDINLSLNSFQGNQKGARTQLRLNAGSQVPGDRNPIKAVSIPRDREVFLPVQLVPRIFCRLSRRELRKPPTYLFS